MLFRIPVEFKLTALRKGGERKQTTTAWSIVDVEVPDYNGEDFPVAVQWKQDFSGVKFAGNPIRIAETIGAAPYDKPMHVRRFGETFFRPTLRERSMPAVKVSALGEDADFLKAESVTEMLSTFQNPGLFATNTPGETHIKRLTQNSGDGFAEFENVEEHNLDAKRRDVAKRLIDQYAVIDGVVYERCPEPTVAVFSAEIATDDGKETATFAFVTTDPWRVMRYDKKAQFFQLEDYELALQKANRMNRSKQCRQELRFANETMVPDIDQMESIYAADVAWMRKVNRIAMHVVKWIGEQKAMSLPDALFDPFKRLYHSLHTPEDEERFATMTQAMADIADVIRDTEMHHLVESVEAALEILDSRPMTAIIGKPVDSQP